MDFGKALLLLKDGKAVTRSGLERQGYVVGFAGTRCPQQDDIALHH